MSGSGKPLLGLWLYRSGEDWSYKEETPIPTVNHNKVRCYILHIFNFFF